MADLNNKSSTITTPDNWGSYMQLKKSKLQEQFEASSAILEVDDDLKNLFKGVSIYVNGYTDPPADELKDIIGKHGGRYDHYYSKSSTSHIVANNLCFSKIKSLRACDQVVRPEWITDSIAACKLLPTEKYLVYRPGVPADQQSLSFQALKRNTGESNAYIDETSNQSTISNGSPQKQSPQKNGMKAGDPGYLETFFSKSRLHHLSAAGNDFKEYVEKLRESPPESFSGLIALKKHVEDENLQVESDSTDVVRKIMHIDMDCFFVSVGRLKRPHLANVPVVVTHAKSAHGMRTANGSDPQFESNYYSNKYNSLNRPIVEEKNKNEETFQSRSEIACASYEARAFGVKNGSYLGVAKQLCPDLVEIPYDFEEYQKVSQILYDTIASFTLEIEAVSCDEMFVDITNVLKETKCVPEVFAKYIRHLIREKSGCSASVGIGLNVLVAKSASKAAKPDGFLVVAPENVKEFFKPMKLRDLHGIGRQTSSKIEEVFSAETCGDLMHASEERLKSVFGPKTGGKLYALVRGKDRDTLILDQATLRKSVSAEINYGIRMTTFEELDNFMKELSKELSTRLEKFNSKGKQLTMRIKVRHPDAPKESAKFMGHGVCNSLSRSNVLRSAIWSPEAIHEASMKIMAGLKIAINDLRGLGLQMSKLEPIQARNNSTATSSTLPNDRSKVMIRDYFNVNTDSNSSLSDFTVLDTKGSNDRGTKSVLIPSMFDTSMRTEKSTIERKPSPPIIDVDEDFIEELPQDIRNEVLSSLGRPIVKLSPKKVQSSKAKDSKRKGKQPMKRVTSGPLDSMFSKSIVVNDEKSILETMSIRGALCGQKDLTMMKDMIMEWVCTEPDLLDEDVACIIKLFTDLVVLNEFDKLKKLLEVLRRQITLRACSHWTESFNTIVSILAMELQDRNHLQAMSEECFKPIEL